MSKFNSLELKDHINFLKKNVFFVETKWPHFDILFDDLIKLSKKTKNNSNVLFLERGGLYGNISIWAPLFYKNNITSIDCSSNKIKKRGQYNKKLIDVKKIIKWPISYFSNYKKISVKKNSLDLIIIPNLFHHIEDHDFLINKCFSFLKKGGRLYIFEPILREVHQAPDDFLRFTPYGLKNIIKKNRFKIEKISTSGGPFSAIIYCWDQALQYLPDKLRKKKNKWLYGNEIKKLFEFEKKYKTNKIRKNSSFPLSFSIIAKK